MNLATMLEHNLAALTSLMTRGRDPIRFWRTTPSQSDPEQPTGPAHGGLRAGAPINSQLLPQRQVLERQAAVSAGENDQ